MKKGIITIENYDKRIQEIKITSLPKILQDGHYFLLDAKKFYAVDTLIKETVDLYLHRLNNHLFTEKELIQEVSETEIDFIKQFLDMHRMVMAKPKIKQYIFDLHKAITQKKISKESPVANHIIQIQQKLIEQYNNLILVEEIRIVINRKWLTGLKKIVKQHNRNSNVGCLGSLFDNTTKQSTLFSPIDQQPLIDTTNTFRLQAALGELLGDLEKFELAITIEGDQGGGKTRFAYQLADAFSGIGNRIAIFSLEIGARSTLITKMKEAYLQSNNRNKIFITDQLPNSYKTIANAAQNFDVIIIDSWNKTGLPSQDFDRLRKQCPDTIFIVIFQRTTQKTIRGGTTPLYDAGINIEVVKVDDTFKNNYAIATKNRYGLTGTKYNISTREILN